MSDATFNAIDLSRLPAPDVIEALSFEAIYAEMLAALKVYIPDFDDLLESDPAVRILQVCAYFRMIDRQRINDAAKAVKGYTQKYHVTEIAIDTKGVGNAVWQNVVTFFPRAKKVLYSPVAKGDMVRKGQNVIRNGRLEFDTASVDLAAALMSIHPHTTKGGNYTTYVSRRTAELGHGDIGWALLNALSIEPLDVTESGTRKRSSVVISQ